jgi:hypothetical protein
MTNVKTHGGARPKSRPDDARGGARPVSGALRNRFTVRPFAHTERGESISETKMIFFRCNSCGAEGWEMRSECIIGKDSITPVYNDQSQPLIHADGCTMKGEE